MLCLKDVSKVYNRRNQDVVAFQIKSLEVRPTDFVAIVGPSGSGKSTLLSMLGGMLAPSSGAVWFHNQSIYDLPVKERTRLRREKIGFVFQTFNLVPYLTALENVQVPLFLNGVARHDQQIRASALLERVGLDGRFHHKPSELSVGQQQRVALARTLANEPELILADEPTGNLDPESRGQVLTFLDELNRSGRTIVMVTHDPNAADRAQRILSLQEGTVVEDRQNRLHNAA